MKTTGYDAIRYYNCIESKYLHAIDNYRSFVKINFSEENDLFRYQRVNLFFEAAYNADLAH
jgi:hypothetical protein